MIKKGLSDEIGVVDAKIGGLLRNKFDSLKIVSDDKIIELHRGMREHLIELLAEMADLDAARSDAMAAASGAPCVAIILAAPAVS